MEIHCCCFKCLNMLFELFETLIILKTCVQKLNTDSVVKVAAGATASGVGDEGVDPRSDHSIEFTNSS